jgi:uncharacterized protein (DUF305 family)
MSLKSKLAPLVAIALLSAPAFAQHSHDAAPAPGAATDELMAAHHNMTASMDGFKSTGDADRDFLTMMIPHHQGAIDMAEAVLKHGKNAEVRALAENIIREQKREIAEMEKMLAQ